MARVVARDMVHQITLLGVARAAVHALERLDARVGQLVRVEVVVAAKRFLTNVADEIFLALVHGADVGVECDVGRVRLWALIAPVLALLDK